jgi:hypothetical protein
MPDVTDSELLRLARKVWPRLRVHPVNTPQYAAVEVDYPSSHGRLLAVEGVDRAPEALHAALLVLAGEESPAERIARLEGQLDGLDDCFRGQLDTEAIRDELHALRGKP